MNKFQEAENKGREYFKEWLKQIGVEEYTFAPNDYDVVDCDFEFKGKRLTTEIKVRDSKYRNYPTHIMELSKYNNVMQYITDNKMDNGIYANFFGEDWLYIYSIKKIDTTEIEMMGAPRTTAGYQGWTSKEMINLPTNTAQIFNRINNKWTRIQ